MSRTNHTTPGFPRTLRGPRGGRQIAPTPCVECVGFASCRPGSCSAPYGCESWVDEDGHRVEPDPRIDYGEPERPCREDPSEPCSDCRNCETTTPDPAGGRFTFETLGGLVKGKCGPADLIEDAFPEIAATLDANTEPLDADRTGSIAHRLIELNDPGPLFAAR